MEKMAVLEWVEIAGAAATFVVRKDWIKEKLRA